MIKSPTDPFAKPEPKGSTNSLRDSALELASGAEVRELDEGDTIPAELLAILESQTTPKP